MTKETNYSLTLVRDAGKTRFKSGTKALGLYRCSCGVEKVIVKSMVETGRTRSCGCLRKHKTALLANTNRKPPGEAALSCVLSSYHRQAKRRGLEFALSRTEFKHTASQDCHYCGASPNQSLRKGKRLNGDFVYNGLDRLDNAEGYTSRNTVACCKTCNYAKHIRSHAEFLDWIFKVYRRATQAPQTTISEKI